MYDIPHHVFGSGHVIWNGRLYLQYTLLLLKHELLSTQTEEHSNHKVVDIK